MYTWIVSIAAFCVLVKFYLKMSSGMCKCHADLTGKVVIVTGANCGIGYETTKELAKRGAKVIMACRDEAKAIFARDILRKQVANLHIKYINLDLASFKSICQFAKTIQETESRLDILVNNAGTGKLDNSLTEDNLPVEMQINYFGPFLLTTLLLPMLKASAPSRIINVASFMHWFGKIDTTKFNKPANGWLAHSEVYSNSKLANILFTKEMSKRLSDTSVTVNSCHPGAVNTEIFRNLPLITRYVFKMFFKTAEEGAQTTIHLAVSPKLHGVSGQYFSDCEVAKTSSAASDPELAKILWEATDNVIRESPIVKKALSQVK